MTLTVILRRERAEDVEAIHQLTAVAFQCAPHSNHSEQFIVKALRDAAVLTISLVAVAGDEVVGHVALSPVSITDGANNWYGLGPISVLPREQGKSIGSQLMREAITGLEQLGANGCVLLGDPNYYYRFGFKAVAGLLLPDVPRRYFQALLIQGVYPQGSVAYHHAFSAQA